MRSATPEWREEFKYWVDGDQARRIISAIKPFAAPDPHTDPSGEATYTVRSVYYDSPCFDFYHQKLDGLRFRKKLRVRSYGGSGLTPHLFLEIKHKRGRLVLKERAKLPSRLGLIALTTNAPSLLAGPDLPAGTIRVAGRFMWLTRQLALTPVILVAYDRTAYVDRSNADVRLTLDRKVRSLLRPAWEDLLDDADLQPCTNGHVILELKFSGRMPQWMRSLLREEGLMQRSISKYCMSLESWMAHLRAPSALPVSTAGD
ncbi:MAG: polyphosphate polymerase domain-containing protein [Candidatus Eisenbacteria bacterium]|nr:polyphosphate polymerase domain-containing protein [Candidatus Eisenbacteria bacterium]